MFTDVKLANSINHKCYNNQCTNVNLTMELEWYFFVDISHTILCSAPFFTWVVRINLFKKAIIYLMVWLNQIRSLENWTINE